MHNDPAARFGYVYGLDGLRLFAVGIVVVRHFDIVKILPGGFGVSIFFFLSGFLISRLLLAEEKRYGEIRLKPFYVRRLVRLLPPLLLMGVIALPALYLTDPSRFSTVQVALSFTYLGNIVKFGAPIFGWSEGYAAIEPLWSLAVEEHFYLLLPPALVAMRGRRARLWILVLAIVFPLLLRVIIFMTADAAMADQINYHFTFTRLDSMAWGVLLTLALDAGWLRAPSRSLTGHTLVWGGAVFMLVTMLHWSTAYEIAIKYSIQSVAIGVFFFGVVFANDYAWLRRILEWRGIVHLGHISYEIYLWHLPILTVLLFFIPSRGVAVPLALVLTFVIADVAYRCTTQRLRDVRKRFGAHPTS